MEKHPLYDKSKIDYRRYYYKNYIAYFNEEKKNQENQNQIKEDYNNPEVKMYSNNSKTEKEVYEKENAKLKPNSKHKGIYAIVMIVLSFIITIISINIITNGFIVKELFSFKDIDNKITYYALTGKAYSTREEALPEAILIRQVGGCSYVLEKDSSYYVIYSVYLDKESAESVQKKNSGTMVLRLDVKKLNNDRYSQPLIEEMDNIAELFETSVKKLYDLSIELEKNQITYLDARIALEEVKTPFLVTKQNIYNNPNLKKTDKDFILLQIEMVQGGIDAIITDNPMPTTLLSDIRYVQAHTIRIYQNLFLYYPSN